MSEIAQQEKIGPHPFSPDTLTCPHAFNRQLRERAPVYHCPETNIYFVSTYDLVMEVAKNDKLYSSRFSQLMTGLKPKPDPELDAIRRQGYPRIDTMLTQDPPLQRRYRALCQKPFSAKSVEKLQPYLAALAGDLIDGFIDKGQCDWMGEFCVPLPVNMIAYILGVPIEDMDLFKAWSDANVYQFAADQDRAELLKTAQQVVDFQHYFAEKIAERKQTPTGDVLSDIVNSTADGEEEPMTVAECLSVIAQLLVAGNETTTATFAEGMYLLCRHPDQLALVQKDLSLVPNMVEEMLRLSTPSAQMWRITTADTELGGVPIPQGSTVMVKWISANRDGDVYADSDKFDVTRSNSRKHLAFGQGVHHCLGAPLARQELIVGWQVILERMTSFRCSHELEYHPSLLLHAPREIQISFDKL